MYTEDIQDTFSKKCLSDHLMKKKRRNSKNHTKTFAARATSLKNTTVLKKSFIIREETRERFKNLSKRNKTWLWIFWIHTTLYVKPLNESGFLGFLRNDMPNKNKLGYVRKNITCYLTDPRQYFWIDPHNQRVAKRWILYTLSRALHVLRQWLY